MRGRDQGHRVDVLQKQVPIHLGVAVRARDVVDAVVGPLEQDVSRYTASPCLARRCTNKASAEQR
jgi:hypothetical protein